MHSPKGYDSDPSEGTGGRARPNPSRGDHEYLGRTTAPYPKPIQTDNCLQPADVIQLSADSWAIEPQISWYGLQVSNQNMGDGAIVIIGVG